MAAPIGKTQATNWAKQRLKKRKRKIGHAPKTTAAYKKSFLAKLEQGIAPRYAAKLAHIARSTIYHWKREDPAFAEAWEEAVQVGVDLVETRLVQRALKTSDSNAQFYLKAHRPDTYGRRESTPPTSVTVRMTLEESRERLRELGIEFPLIIEGDCIEEDITVPRITDASDSNTSE